EGASDAPDMEGSGASAEPGDATWLNTFFPDQFWSTVGGTFAPQESASTLITVVDFYTWSSPAMAADVQSGLNAPAANFGWFLLGDETQFPSAKRFDTRENATAEFRPMLTITYVPAPSFAAALLILAPATAFRRPARRR